MIYAMYDELHWKHRSPPALESSHATAVEISDFGHRGRQRRFVLMIRNPLTIVITTALTTEERVGLRLQRCFLRGCNNRIDVGNNWWISGKWLLIIGTVIGTEL